MATTKASATPASQLDPTIMRDEMRRVRGAAVSSPTITTVHRRMGILGRRPDDGTVTHRSFRHLGSVDKGEPLVGGPGRFIAPNAPLVAECFVRLLAHTH